MAEGWRQAEVLERNLAGRVSRAWCPRVCGEEGRVWRDALISALGIEEDVKDIDQDTNGRGGVR